MPADFALASLRIAISFLVAWHELQKLSLLIRPCCNNTFFPISNEYLINAFLVFLLMPQKLISESIPEIVLFPYAI